MSDYTPTEDDAQHIERLQILRESGTHNMVTELLGGLRAHFGEQGRETYDWTVEHWTYFESSEWVDIDVEELKDVRQS